MLLVVCCFSSTKRMGEALKESFELSLGSLHPETRKNKKKARPPPKKKLQKWLIFSPLGVDLAQFLEGGPFVLRFLWSFCFLEERLRARRERERVCERE